MKFLNTVLFTLSLLASIEALPLNFISTKTIPASLLSEAGKSLQREVSGYKTIEVSISATKTIPTLSTKVPPTTKTIPSTTSKALPITKTIPSTTSKALPTTKTIPSATSKALPTTKTIPSSTSKALPTTKTIPSSTSKGLPITKTIPSSTSKGLPITKTIPTLSSKIPPTTKTAPTKSTKAAPNTTTKTTPFTKTINISEVDSVIKSLPTTISSKIYSNNRAAPISATDEMEIEEGIEEEVEVTHDDNDIQSEVEVEVEEIMGNNVHVEDGNDETFDVKSDAEETEVIIYEDEGAAETNANVGSIDGTSVTYSDDEEEIKGTFENNVEYSEEDEKMEYETEDDINNNDVAIVVDQEMEDANDSEMEDDAMAYDEEIVNEVAAYDAEVAANDAEANDSIIEDGFDGFEEF